jgi:hypothetical protein
MQHIGYRPTEPLALRSVPDQPELAQPEQDVISQMQKDLRIIRLLTQIRFVVGLVVAFTIVIGVLYLMHEVSILMSAPVPQAACDPAVTSC